MNAIFGRGAPGYAMLAFPVTPPPAAEFVKRALERAGLSVTVATQNADEIMVVLILRKDQVDDIAPDLWPQMLGPAKPEPHHGYEK